MTDREPALKNILPVSCLLLEQYRELDLADISPEERLILKGRGHLLVDATGGTVLTVEIFSCNNCSCRVPRKTAVEIFRMSNIILGISGF